MIHTSTCQPGPAVTFPEWRGERHYMLPFNPQTLSGVPARFRATVAQMIRATPDAEQECYLMVDEAEVPAGGFHRRPGLHVDGYWQVPVQCHGGGGGGGHVARRRSNHGPGRGGHGATPIHGPYWGSSSVQPEALLLASNVAACRALVGEYRRDFVADWRGGDCADLDTTELQCRELHPGRVYKLDVFSLHESLPVVETCRRTVVRINVPGVA